MSGEAEPSLSSGLETTAQPSLNHGSTTAQLPATVLTELGLEVPPPPDQEWREHTAERWKERDRATYDHCIHLIKSGVTNQTKLAAMFGKSRNSIDALMFEAFTEDELVEIGKKKARIGELAGISKTTELIEEADDAKLVGGVAMASNLLHQMAQSLNDKPDSIKETRVRVTVEDFTASLEDEAGLKKLNDCGTIVDVVESGLEKPVEMTNAE